MLVAAMMVIATLAAYWAGERTGEYWGVVVVLVAVAGYWFLEAKPSPGTVTYALQYLLVRSLLALIVVASGATLIYMGVSELSSPLVFSRPLSNAAAGVVREIVGSVGVATVLCVGGVAVIVQGLRLFPGREGGVSRG